MKYLIDTDQIADYLKGREPAVQIIDSLLKAKDELAISLISYGEIYEGVYYGRDPKAAERGFKQFLRAFAVVPLNRAIKRQFGLARGDLRRKGHIIGDADLLIGATALHYDYTVITRNLSHFQRIDGLKLYRLPTP